MSLDELIPDDVQEVKEVEAECPVCKDKENLQITHRGMANCQNDNCPIYAFHPLREYDE